MKGLSENPKNQFLFAIIHLEEPSKLYVVSGRDYTNQGKVVVACRDGFGSVFASYRDKGIDGREPIKFEALKPFINLKKDKFKILDYDTIAILTKNSYRCTLQYSKKIFMSSRQCSCLNKYGKSLSRCLS